MIVFSFLGDKEKKVEEVVTQIPGRTCKTKQKKFLSVVEVQIKTLTSNIYFQVYNVTKTPKTKH